MQGYSIVEMTVDYRKNSIYYTCLDRCKRIKGITDINTSRFNLTIIGLFNLTVIDPEMWTMVKSYIHNDKTAKVPAFIELTV